jgi:tetratricopeptide (TPR) repeat protein
MDQFERVMLDDPLNALFGHMKGMALAGAGDPAGETELLKFLEVNENFWIAILWLAAFYLVNGRVDEALRFAERGYSLVPSHRGVIGQIAGICKRAGDAQRSEALLQTLGSGSEYGNWVGFFSFHMACGELEQAAVWLEKAIEQRDTRAPWILPHLYGPGFTASPRWPRLAKMMNLPESVW